MPEAAAGLRILVIGASGRTGRKFVSQALARQHHVTAIVRRTAVFAPCPGLTVVEGNVLDHSFLANVLDGQHLLVSSLARGNQNASVLSDAAEALVRALHVCIAPPRVIMVSQGLLFASRNPVVHLLRWLLRATIADSKEMERRVSKSGADWTIVRPPRLTEAKAQGHYVVRANARPPGGSAMARADLATFLIDEAERATFRNMIVGIA